MREIPPSSASRRPNRLIKERSPYLLAHAYNPVDWYPWGDEAFEEARRMDRPIFLSVGYSTCHWCHVMAEESFEDPEVAALMNEAFVCVKVDREERPDIDGIYMAAAVAMTGGGGWPLTVVMTPEGEPFFAATYIPRTGRFGRIGLKELIPMISEMWQKERGQLLGISDKLMERLREREDVVGCRPPDASTLERGYVELSALYDASNGGFGGAPKFPAPHNIFFLLRYWYRTGLHQPLEMAETTLQAMRMGGIYDHVGFGFHRYSTDAGWQVPHFEKMLYDQALLTMAYTEAYQATGRGEYARTAREILEYLLRDMRSPEGGFYSAQDADSEGEEGRYYLWKEEELSAILDREEWGLVIRLFDIHEGGNFEGGGNILRLRSTMRDAASVLGIGEEELSARLERIRERLLSARSRRARPSRDEKILCDWNGLTIAALSAAARALDEPEYALAARGAAEFILERMRTQDGRLLHRYLGEAGVQANLDDYAFLIWGLIDLYEAVLDSRYLRAALELNRLMLDHFWDGERGGLFFTPDDGERLLVRRKVAYDGATPSGNSAAMLNLMRLAHLTGDAEMEERAWKIANALSCSLDLRPSGHTMLLSALEFATGPSFEIVLVGDPEEEGLQRLLGAVRSRYLPGGVVILASDDMSGMLNLTDGMARIDGLPTAYICSGNRCLAPTTDPERVKEILDRPG
ncbi:MAG: thioredoxin domain-containing protein [Methanothrix sp.]|nr:thioredoxin domain-containing protein [Methanothrix sp.]